MSKVSPLNNEKHSDIKIAASSDYRRFKEQNLIPVIAHDFSLLATEFPIVFVKNSETGQFIAVAMMGIKSGLNLYCQTEHWGSPVTPIGFTNAPFSLVKKNADSDEVVVCIDEESNLVNKTSGESLFNAQGEQSDYLNNKAKKLIQIAQNTIQTQGITQLFSEKKLLTARQLTVNLLDEKEPFVISGIYTIDETILNAMPIEEFEQLRSQGLLPLIYAHLTSLHQMTRLTKKHNDFMAK